MVCLYAFNCSLKQYNDAAAMYVKAEQFDKAAAILIHTKNFTAVTPLLGKITLPKLHAQYAKVRCSAAVVLYGVVFSNWFSFGGH